MNAALAVAARRNTRLCLIASRRQVDAATLGGGYVNHWSTEDFAAYVRAHDAGGFVTLARDHGGPYERDEEKSLSLPDAMAVAKRSYEADILAGLKVLHLDPERAVERGATGAIHTFTNLTIELLLAADKFAKSSGIPDVQFEIGTDEGAAQDFTIPEWSEFLSQVMMASQRHNVNTPLTFAVPMGTKVKEMQNVGGMIVGDEAVQQQWLEKIDGLRGLAKTHHLTLKLHNADYLTAQQIKRFTAAGVQCVNVAPEFGVVETRALLDILRTHGMENMADAFLKCAYASRKWERWMLPNTTATDEEKSCIAGHYVFALPEMVELRNYAQTILAGKGIDLNAALQSAIETTIERYLIAMDVCDAKTCAA